LSLKPRDLLLRLLLTLGLIASGATLYIGLSDGLRDQQSLGERELLGVQYLASLQPLAAALAKVESAVVGADPAAAQSASASLTAAIADTAATDDGIGDELGTRARWQDLRDRLSALPPSGNPRTLYTTYRNVSDLLQALAERAADVSGLSNDADPDTYYLHRTVTADLPELMLATARLTDLAAIDNSVAGDVADQADLIAFDREATQVAQRLDDDVQAAASATPQGLPTTAVPGALETVRTELGTFLAGADTVLDGHITAADAAGVTGARTRLTAAAATLSAAILDELKALIGERRDAAAAGRSTAAIALSVLVVLALVPTGSGLFRLVRQRRVRHAVAPTAVSAMTRPVTTPERERAGAR
jgi:hypothetical protein